MRFISSALPLAGLATAIVVPENVNDPHAWADFLHSEESVQGSLEDLASVFKHQYDEFTSFSEHALSSAGASIKHAFDEAVEAVEAEREAAINPLGLELDNEGHHDHHKTIYELIKAGEHTTKFAKLIDEYDSVVDLLNSTKANHTLFVPTDDVFDRIPDDAPKPPKDVIEKILRYHVSEGIYLQGLKSFAHTLTTAYDEELLGGRPQRLRVRLGLHGATVNFYAHVQAANFPARNGVVHAINHFLVPPPYVGREITLFPAQFSTLLLAYEKTDFVQFIHHVNMDLGSTVFAPNNRAFEKLGPAANAFLFNTDRGRQHLKALLKYHISANSTLYSDVLYPVKGKPVHFLGEEAEESQEAGVTLEADADADAGAAGAYRKYRVELPSLLDDGKPISVDVTVFLGSIWLGVNGRTRVSVQDGVAKNGVIQVVDSVLIPPKSLQSEDDDAWVADGEISVEDLIERLAPYVDEENQPVDDEEWSDL